MRSTALLSGITLQPGTLCAVLLDRLTRSLGKDPDSATQRDIYDALSLAVREELAARWLSTQRRISQAGVKRVLVVPGSGLVKRQAEAEGLHEVFLAAGFEWREPGCSMCLAMNADRLEPGERCASTSNRNFEGRQGAGGRTHLVSPAMAAAAAVTGRFTDVRAL